MEQKEELFNRFSEAVYAVYDVDIINNSGALLVLYPSIMSKISMSEARLSKRFQVIYSFCRSMWMTFFILTIGCVYIVLGYNFGWVTLPYNGGYEPIWASFLTSNSIPLFIIPVGTGLITLGFLIACGKYKYHYIEYIIADFPFVVNFDERRGKQAELSDWANGDTND